MANSRIELRGYFESIPDGSVSIAPTPMENPTSPSEVQTAILTVGDNASTPPPNAMGVLITLPVASTTDQSRLLKSDAGDVGFPLPQTANFVVLPFDPSNPPTAVIVTVTTNDDTEVSTFRYF
jgi:hypothetical protein